LKKHAGSRQVQSQLLEVIEEGIISAEPMALLDRRLGRTGNRGEVYVLI